MAIAQQGRRFLSEQEAFQSFARDLARVLTPDPSPSVDRVKVTHYRQTMEAPDTLIPTSIVRLFGLHPLPRGGATCALLLDEQDNVLVERWALCSERDNFCRRIGWDIAVGRAFKQLEEYGSRYAG